VGGVYQDGAVLADPAYHEGLERFGRELEELTGPGWRLEAGARRALSRPRGS
jgi:hypothetical protein